MDIIIRKAESCDLPALAGLGVKLWPSHTAAELEADFGELMAGGAAYFLALAEGIPAGFAQCQLRRDYVEGTQTSPVGYLEGIFTAEEFRGRGIARQLLAACEAWARDRGCTEFASDCELDNVQSLRFHLGVGFEEANRIICFTKKL